MEQTREEWLAGLGLLDWVTVDIVKNRRNRNTVNPTHKVRFVDGLFEVDGHYYNRATGLGYMGQLVPPTTEETARAEHEWDVGHLKCSITTRLTTDQLQRIAAIVKEAEATDAT